MDNQEQYEIHYSLPRFHRRVFANLVDFLLFVFLFFLLFLGSRAAITNMPFYLERDKALLTIRSDSGLYHVEGNSSIDIVTYLADDSNQYTAYQKMRLSEKAIDDFIVYIGNEVSKDDGEKVQADYDKYRLSSSLAYENVPYFVMDGDTIIRNKECKADNETYFLKAYAPYIDTQCQGYLVTLVPEYLEVLKFESYMLFFAEIPIAYFLSSILVYLLPPVFFKHGRMTLGKSMYHIALVDSRLLSCSFPRYLARWSIFFFLELCLSLFTFGLPCLISFTMMVCTKNKQGFPDYLLGLCEVDASHEKIYRSYEEISLDGIEGEKEPVDFKPTYED